MENYFLLAGHLHLHGQGARGHQTILFDVPEGLSSPSSIRRRSMAVPSRRFPPLLPTTILFLPLDLLLPVELLAVSSTRAQSLLQAFLLMAYLTRAAGVLRLLGLGAAWADSCTE